MCVGSGHLSHLSVVQGRDALPKPAPSHHCFQVLSVDFCSVSCREISHPPPLLSPQNAPHIALGPHLRPPFLGVPSALCQTPGERGPSLHSPAELALGEAGLSAEMNNPVFPSLSLGYGFLQPAQAEMFARQQEMLRKQNLAR